MRSREKLRPRRTASQLNHRKILDGIFTLAGVPADKTRTISSAVDKLDKMAWADVRREMTEEKGLDGEIADRIGKYVSVKGGCSGSVACGVGGNAEACR